MPKSIHGLYKYPVYKFGVFRTTKATELCITKVTNTSNMLSMAHKFSNMATIFNISSESFL